MQDNQQRKISPVKKGYGMGVASLSPITGALLHSAMDKLGRVLACNPEDGKMHNQTWQNTFHSIKVS